jgi:hypothetical protein
MTKVITCFTGKQSPMTSYYLPDIENEYHSLPLKQQITPKMTARTSVGTLGLSIYKEQQISQL